MVGVMRRRQQPPREPTQKDKVLLRRKRVTYSRPTIAWHEDSGAPFRGHAALTQTLWKRDLSQTKLHFDHMGGFNTVLSKKGTRIAPCSTCVASRMLQAVVESALPCQAHFTFTPHERLSHFLPGVPPLCTNTEEKLKMTPSGTEAAAAYNTRDK